MEGTKVIVGNGDGKESNMGENTIYYISEAAKKVQVEAHVLRYWEDELQLAIKRNEMGHRCYTAGDIEQLQQIKLLKEQGLQLKAIRTVLRGGGMIPGTETTVPISENMKSSQEAERQKEKKQGPEKQKEGKWKEEGQEIESKVGRDESSTNRKGINHMENVENMDHKIEDMVMKKAKKYMVTLSKGKETIIETPQEELSEYTVEEDMDKTRKAARLQYLLQHMVTEAVKSANQEMCTEIKESILKELDYQFRQQEERDEEHWKKEEEHYRKIDEMIRQRHLPKEKLPKGKRKSPINL